MKPTIVFLHGLNCSSKIFSFLHTQLPNHTPVFIDYQSQQPIQDSFAHIVRKLPKKPFTIIGHSLGGVLGYLIASRTKMKVEKLVTISSPFGGSQVAGLLRWFYPHFSILRDLSPRSHVMKEIQEYPPLCPFLSLVSVSGHLPFISDKNDGVVTIQSQSCVYPTQRVEVQANHFEAVQDMVGIEAIRNFIFRE